MLRFAPEMIEDEPDTIGYTFWCPLCDRRKTRFSAKYGCWVCMECGLLFDPHAEGVEDD